MGNDIKSCGSNCLSNLKHNKEVKIDNNNKYKLADQISKNPKQVNRLIKIQALFRGALYRLKFRKFILKKQTSNNDRKLIPDTCSNIKYRFVETTNKISEDKFFNLLSNYKALDDKVKIENVILEYENDSVYYGEFNISKSQRHGRGIQYWNTGSMYQGYWINDKASKYGILIHADNDIYEGDWRNNKANGKGTYVHYDGSTYTGEWLDDKQHGLGKETWPDGAVYEGEFVNGYKNGNGVFTWIDGSSYKGNFRENNIEGIGNFKYSLICFNYIFYNYN